MILFINNKNNKIINIAEILKYCPKGTKLYSTIFGEVILNKINIHEKYPIVVYRLNHIRTSFTREGYYMEDFPGSECVLFPSKEQRDWNKFRLPVKRGDIMMGMEELEREHEELPSDFDE